MNPFAQRQVNALAELSLGGVGRHSPPMAEQEGLHASAKGIRHTARFMHKNGQTYRFPKTSHLIRDPYSSLE